MKFINKHHHTFQKKGSTDDPTPQFRFERMSGRKPNES